MFYIDFERHIHPGQSNFVNSFAERSVMWLTLLVMWLALFVMRLALFIGKIVTLGWKGLIQAVFIFIYSSVYLNIHLFIWLPDCFFVY